ncbi:hypothetical protein PR002_g15919 [Phytophthora rubi]|uniref:Uncharacterized protein n=1 Tax=Phytophthora rubi TaxID=129364 RepID=A0A6A3KMA2_9STRA|nr:hypothetical protein PR002_g15919 [Phytophthora rubi]
MYETTDLEVNTNGLEDEDYDDERSAWSRDEDDYNETAPVGVVNPKFGGVLPTEVGRLGYGINAVKEKECDEVSTLPVEATSGGEDKMNGTTVEVGNTTCAGTPPGRDGGNLVERSELAGEGKHSDDEDPADGALGTLSGDVEMVRAEVVAGVTDASPTAKPQVEEDRSKGAVRNAPPLDRLFTSEELDLLMEERSEAFPDREPGRPEVDDLYEYVYSVGDGDGTRRRQKPGLVEVSEVESNSDDDEEPSFLWDG